MPNDLPVPPEIDHLIEKREEKERRQKKVAVSRERRKTKDRRDNQKKSGK
ncbi:MAG: hypothetical protein R3C11_03005 [Planctomycetaceae bacterium]